MKKLSNRLPKVGRGTQTIGFFALTAVLLCLLWGFWGYPLPTEQMEFRRLERQRLVQTDGDILQFTVGERDYIAGVGSNQLNLCVLAYDWLESFPIPDGGGLFPVYGHIWYPGEYALLAAGLPDDVYRVELTLSLSTWSYESLRDAPLEQRVCLELPHDDPGMEGIYRPHQWQYTLEGDALSSGSFLFRISPHGDMWAEDAQAEDVAEEHALFYIGKKYNYFRAQEGRPPTVNFQSEAVCYKTDGSTSSLYLDLLTEIQAQSHMKGGAA